MELLGANSLNYGKIICKCNLIDCIYMTKEYIEEIIIKNIFVVNIKKADMHGY